MMDIFVYHKIRESGIHSTGHKNIHHKYSSLLTTRFLCPVEWIPDSRILWYIHCHDCCPCVNPHHTPLGICNSIHVVFIFFYSCLFSLASFFFLLPCFPLLRYVRGITPMIRPQNIMKEFFALV